MYIGKMCQSLVCLMKNKNKHEDPRPRKNELFQKDGWGPRQPAETIKPHKYRGPHYPLPMRLRTFEASEESIRLCNAARNAWSLKALDEAACCYIKASEKTPGNPDFLFELAQLKWSENLLEEAKNLLEKALEFKPNWYPLLVSLFLVNLERQDKHGADVVCGKLIRCTPHAPFDIECAASRRAYRDLP
jgi:tetratricopeptide (TPR) repeat protein